MKKQVEAKAKSKDSILNLDLNLKNNNGGKV
jgi:hypothetical protein